MFTTQDSGNLVRSGTWFSDQYNPYLGSVFQSSAQYFDGLGRPTESVKEGYTPSGQNLKSFMTYDNLGRQDRTYQPFESMNNLFEPIASTTPRATSPYVNPEYEASPLSRPLKQINEDLSESTMAYGTNTIEDAVKLFTVNATNTLQATNVALGKPVTLVNYEYASASSGGNALEMVANPNSEWLFDATTNQSSIIRWRRELAHGAPVRPSVQKTNGVVARL